MIRQLWRLVDDPGHRRRYLLTALAAMITRTATVLLLFPLLSRLLSGEPTQALPWLAALAASVALGWYVDRALSLAAFDIGFDLLTSVERRVLDRVTRMPLGWLDLDRQQKVRRILATAGHELCTGVAYLITPAFSALGSSLLIAVGLLFVAPALGVVALVAIPMALGALALGTRTVRSADEAYAAASSETGHRILEVARAQRVLRAAGRAAGEGSSVRRALDEQRSAALRLIRRTVPGDLLFATVAQLVLIALAATVIVLMLRGEYSAAEVVALVVVAVRFLEPFTSYAGLAPALEAARGSLARVDEVLAAAPLPEPAKGAEPAAGGSAVVFDRVSFRYDPDGPLVLDEVSIDVPAGSTTAIVGPSGSGKSTLLALLARTEDVDSGGVRVLGHDVRDYRLDTLLSSLAIVFQDVYLADRTVRENIRLGNPAASDEQVLAAGRAAQLDEVVARLPQGWDTRVGEGGDLLSGGEKQRVSVARALVRDAPLLLLDEATSALDTHNERGLVSALDTQAAGRTTIVVAHRLSTIAHADQILFLDGGRIVEQGTLQELLAAGGRLADYWHQRESAAEWVLS